MASMKEVEILRRISSYTGSEPYDDNDLAEMIDAGNVHLVASQLWNEKAASLTSLVDTSESGSSRKLGDAYKNALEMAKYYKGIGDKEVTTDPVDTSRFARTRAIIRESA